MDKQLKILLVLASLLFIHILLIDSSLLSMATQIPVTAQWTNASDFFNWVQAARLKNVDQGFIFSPVHLQNREMPRHTLCMCGLRVTHCYTTKRQHGLTGSTAAALLFRITARSSFTLQLYHPFVPIILNLALN